MFDFSQFDAYRRENTHMRGHREYCDVDTLLRFWRDAKSEYLMNLFGDQLILERSFEYNRNRDELDRAMSDMVRAHRDFLCQFENKFLTAAQVDDMYDDDDKSRVARYICCFSNYLVNNEVCLPSHYHSYEHIKSYTFELNGKKVTVQNGQKLTRAIGTICRALGMDEEWEKFRIAHSLVLNQKKIKGTLCLSIHPLDYATASDNDNGWSSCMSWREEGCYRMGTVEMMNSPMVICSYVKSDKAEMEIDGRPWNSKKWRAWVIVTKDAICTNRQYPYHSDEIAIEVIKWVKELCGQKFGWQYDEEVHTDFYGYMDEVMGDGNHIEYCTNYMYNDMGDTDILGVLRADHKHLPGHINFSGKAECMICGSEIGINDQEASCLECRDCYSEYCCSRCGAELDEDEVYYDPDGEALCYDCWQERCAECVECGETVWNDYATRISFPTFVERAEEWVKNHPEATEVKRFIEKRGTWFHREMQDQYGEEKVICDNCLYRNGWSDHVYEVDFEDDDKMKRVRYGEMRVLDPNKVDKDAYLEHVEVPYFSRAKRILDDSYPWRDSATREEKTHAKMWIDFWYDQYEKFTEEFNAAEIA